MFRSLSSGFFYSCRFFSAIPDDRFVLKIVVKCSEHVTNYWHNKELIESIGLSLCTAATVFKPPLWHLSFCSSHGFSPLIGLAAQVVCRVVSISLPICGCRLGHRVWCHFMQYGLQQRYVDFTLAVQNVVMIHMLNCLVRDESITHKRLKRMQILMGKDKHA